ncbi:tRNA (N(6)-L-threonylcarbamoyladenosine(37)-C(2))-methylthiotransferase [Candidatus Bathyarchaeota archaeon]|nr:tRNA (N(6)-L-threonylcarbamoyladenosine(37)-C(2))-methylthiotransferase [Candidatus Bathyarchaeota archaeon]
MEARGLGRLEGRAKPSMMAKVYIEAHGCSLSLSDSEAMAGILHSVGYELSQEPSEADLNILVTCIVKGPTENRMRYRVRALSAMEKPLIVAGCMPEVEEKVLESLNPRASLLGPNSIGMIAEAVASTLSGKRFVAIRRGPEEKLGLPRLRRNPVVGIIPIASGCLGVCSFCQVRLARGRLYSYPPKAIVSEAIRAIKEGCRELWLTSQDNGCYGLDIGSSLPELIRFVAGIEGDFMVRVGMANPTYVKQFLEELLDAYKNEKVFKFLHIPIQSFCSRILCLMRRGYGPDDAMEIINAFRRTFPEGTLATDVIVGFPTETEEEFEETLEFVAKVKPEIVNISKFSPRQGTEAARLPRLPSEVVAKRSRLLTELSRKVSLERNEGWIGWEGTCIIEEPGLKPNQWIGRNMAYRPILIDEVSKNLLGKSAIVRVVGATSRCLKGKIIA